MVTIRMPWLHFLLRLLCFAIFILLLLLTVGKRNIDEIYKYKGTTIPSKPIDTSKSSTFLSPITNSGETTAKPDDKPDFMTLGMLQFSCSQKTKESYYD